MSAGAAGGGGGAGGRGPGRDSSAGDGGGWRVTPGPCTAVLLLIRQPLEVTVPGNLLRHGHVSRLPVGGLQLVLDHHLLGESVVGPLQSFPENIEEVENSSTNSQVTTIPDCVLIIDSWLEPW